MDIIWTENAYLANLNNIDYLLKNWGLNVTLEYERKIHAIEKIISDNPLAGSSIQELGIRKILVVPKIYLLYEYIDFKIVILDVWNNLQKPYW